MWSGGTEEASWRRRRTSSRSRTTTPPSCGRLPEWARERPEGSYFGYFENEFGEQWIFLATKGSVRLAGGDLGWEQVHELLQPNWRDVDEWLTIHADLEKDELRGSWPTVTMNAAESDWLRAVATAAAARFGAHGYAP